MTCTIEQHRARIEWLRARLKERLHPLEMQATWAHLRREQEALDEALRRKKRST